jgi:hypothetical protein
MKKIAFLFLCLATVANAGLFDKDTKVKNMACFDSGKVDTKVFVLWTFSVDKNSVVQKEDVYDDKVLKGTNLNRLEDCIVIDKANWQCGGKVTTYNNGSYRTDRIFQVIKGKYTYTETSRNGVPSNLFCRIEQLN